MIPLRPLTIAIAASLLAVPATAQTPQTPQTPEEVAAAALEAAPIWDGHNDLPIQLRARRGNVLDHFDLHDTTDEPPRTQGGAGGTGRPIYEFDYGGQTHRLAITVGDNGFVVGANFR